jgi:hypothetical protein
VERVGISKLWAFLDGARQADIVTNGSVRLDAGFQVKSYLELAGRVAELQYRNQNYVLLFRGQSHDWKSDKGLTTLKPTIFRPLPSRDTVSDRVVERRFKTLIEGEERLAKGFQKLQKLGRQRVTRERLLRWSILQHYEVCATPLLDVTRSLRIAASFASLKGGSEAFVFVLAVPNLSGAITANSESGLQIVRLASVCPPAAIRPHIQEGYLLGEYPEMVGLTQARHYRAFEMDFGRRILAKFRFNPHTFWDDQTFPQIPEGALYPKGRDWLEQLTAEIATKVGQSATSKD